MNVKVQMSMVLNLDKCLACHTCSLPCKNAWTTAPGAEYIWFNNVETKPGIGYPKRWEDQNLHQGGWEKHKGRLRLRAGGKAARLANIFANPHLPPLDDYYQPWNYNYEHLTTSPPASQQPVARPHSPITGQPFNPQWGVNWEDDLAGTTSREDPNFKGLDAEYWCRFEQVFMLHLPRLCEHCLHPACVASCPSGAMYKRDEDGIVLADQTRCRSWRFCMSGCPYKKVYYNWKDHHADKCLFCYPRLEAGEPTLCAQSCTGRIRYVGVMLYDADKVTDAAATEADEALYEAQLGVFLDPADPAVIRAAQQAGINGHVLDAARRSPIWKLACHWRLALPLHPEFRTLPMVWYIPPTSPLRPTPEGEPDPATLACSELADHMRIPVAFMANLFTAGDEAPVRLALARLTALRRFMREATFTKPLTAAQEDTGQTGNVPPPTPAVLADLASVGLDADMARAMHRLLATARFDERFVIPSTRPELHADPQAIKGCAGYPEPLS